MTHCITSTVNKSHVKIQTKYKLILVSITFVSQLWHVYSICQWATVDSCSGWCFFITMNMQTFFFFAYMQDKLMAIFSIEAKLRVAMGIGFWSVCILTLLKMMQQWMDGRTHPEKDAFQFSLCSVDQWIAPTKSSHMSLTSILVYCRTSSIH